MTMSERFAHFDGAKVAILRGGDVLTLLRDDRSDIPYPAQWDLPGGGREGDETPFETLSREVFEELSLTLDPAQVIYHAEERGHVDPARVVHFFVLRWDELSDAQIKLGDEGQGWAWMEARAFTMREDAVSPLRGRLTRALDALGL